MSDTIPLKSSPPTPTTARPSRSTTSASVTRDQWGEFAVYRDDVQLAAFATDGVSTGARAAPTLAANGQRSVL